MIVECPACQSRYDVTGRPPGTRARCRCGQIFLLPHPTRTAATLDCPKCGAGVSPTCHTCEYCSAALLLKACPRCFARIFHGAKHCSECGAKVEVPAAANASGEAIVRGCPRCDDHQDLVARLVGDVLLDECPGCHGVWLDTAQLDQLLEERRGTSADAVLGMGGPRPAPSDRPEEPSRTYIKCPDCQVVMNRVNFARRSGVIVDVCRAHGTWFDHSELPKIIAFVRAGGLDEAMRRDAEDKMQEARRRETAARMQAARPTGVYGGTQDDRIVSVFGGLLGAISIGLGDW